jgi:HK97 family phage major capsid protein
LSRKGVFFFQSRETCALALTIKEALERRGEVENKIDEVLTRVDSTGKLTAEDEQLFDSLMSESKSLKAHADRLKEREDVKADVADIVDEARSVGLKVADEDIQARAFAAWMKSNSPSASGLRGTITDADRKAAKECGIALDETEARFPLLSRAQARAAIARHRNEVLGLSRQTDGGGGMFISETFIGALEVAMHAYGGVLQVADVIRTPNANPFSWPSFDDESTKATRTKEGKAVGTATDLAFQKTSWGAHKYESGVLKVTYETLRDVPLDLPALIGAAFGERFGRKQSTDMTTGDGANGPQGIVTGSVASGITTASATDITFDELVDLIHSIDPAIRGMGCGFMFNDAVAKILRKKKDSTGAYTIWQPSTVAGMPDVIFNYPIYYNYDMEDPAASKKSVLFGKLSAYKVRQVGQVRSYRADELYLAEEKVGFMAFLEADGGILNPSKSAAGAPIKYLLQHA